jgi:hypothetical protein
VRRVSGEVGRKTTVRQEIIDVTEQKQLNDAREKGIPWKKRGPYLRARRGKQAQIEERPCSTPDVNRALVNSLQRG